MNTFIQLPIEMLPEQNGKYTFVYADGSMHTHEHNANNKGMLVFASKQLENSERVIAFLHPLNVNMLIQRAVAYGVGTCAGIFGAETKPSVLFGVVENFIKNEQNSDKLTPIERYFYQNINTFL